jgi:cyclopropane-fatty-acyl-phospholipid synthase
MSAMAQVQAAGNRRPSFGPWQDVASAPRAPSRALAAKMLFRRAMSRLPVRVTLPDGRSFGGGDGAAPTMKLDRPAQFYRRLGSTGLIGFGESYMVGDWRCDDLAAFLTPFARRVTTLVPKSLQRLRSRWQTRQPSSEENDLRGARSNIARHYDLSNEMFALFLDETMTYSSAIWGTSDNLADAQRRKIDRLLDLAAVKNGARVLEIGTGWGELAIRAANRGATVTTLTLSREQQQLARERVAAADLERQVDVQLRDYREATGSYDAVVSVEMIEAVGEKYWPDYFAAIDRLLARDGRVAIQAITIDHDRYLGTRNSYTWIHKYIFPGGILPSLQAISDTARAHTTLAVTSCTAFGQHYARTLHAWLDNFRANKPRVEALGFDERFQRMWEFYLAYCEAGFTAGYINVEQLLLERR